MKSYEAFWAENWDSDGEVSDFDHVGTIDSEMSVIELLDTLEDVERVTSASTFLNTRPHPFREKHQPEARRDYIFDAYAFNSSSYDLTIQCLENGRTPTEQELRNADPLFPEKKRFSKKFFEGVVGRWRKFCSSLEVIEVDRGDGVLRKALHAKWDKTNRLIAHRDEWLAIVDSHHVDPMTLKCLNLRATSQNIGRNYITGSKRHGIPEEYIRARIAECCQCNEKCENNFLIDETAYPSKRLRSTLPDRWPEVHTIPWQQVDSFIETLCIRHKVSLKRESVYRIVRPEPSIVSTWVCSRGFVKSRWPGNLEQDNQNIVHKQQKVCCTFRVRTIIPIRLAMLPEFASDAEGSSFVSQESLRCNDKVESSFRNVPVASISNGNIPEPPSNFSQFPDPNCSSMQLPKVTKLGSSHGNILPHTRSDGNAEQPLSNVLGCSSNGHAQQVSFEERNSLSSCGGVDEYPTQESSFIINSEHFMAYSQASHSLDDSNHQNLVHSESSVLVTVLVHRAHRGHDPFSKDDYIHFPIHSSAREAVISELDLTSDLAAVSRASLRMDAFLKSRASDLEKATFRFFMTPKDIALLTVEFSSQDLEH